MGGLGIDDPVWVATVFTKNRDRLLTTGMSRRFLAAILAHRDVAALMSDEHFSVDGTLIKAWASMKSFQPKTENPPPGGDGPDDPPPPADDHKPDQPEPDQPEPDQPEPETAPMTRPARRDRNAEVDFRGEKRSNATHVSTTDPDARLYKKSPGTGAMLCFMGHTLMENRSGLIVQAELTHADGHAERRAALDMIHRHSPGSTRRLTLGADKGYDSADFVAELRKACVTPHVAQRARHSAIDGRTTRHEGYALSQKRRKRIEEPFGWAKTVGGMAQTVYRGVERVRPRPPEEDERLPADLVDGSAAGGLHGDVRQGEGRLVDVLGAGSATARHRAIVGSRPPDPRACVTLVGRDGMMGRPPHPRRTPWPTSPATAVAVARSTSC